MYKAGAGLGFFERNFILHFILPLSKLFLNWDTSSYFLNKEIKKIKSLVFPINSKDKSKQVMIDKIFGIENHSRDFSINMTIEHLYIVGNGIFTLVDTLSNEKEFELDIKIENVKPNKKHANMETEYYNLMNTYAQYIKNHDKSISTVTKEHPWFCKLNNMQWHSFMLIHTMVHRRQIEKIIKKLNN